MAGGLIEAGASARAASVMGRVPQPEYQMLSLTIFDAVRVATRPIGVATATARRTLAEARALIANDTSSEKLARIERRA